MQSFNLNPDGSLTPVSWPVGSGQIAVCWITVSGQNVYTTNYLTNDVTSYTADRTGSLTLNARGRESSPAPCGRTWSGPTALAAGRTGGAN